MTGTPVTATDLDALAARLHLALGRLIRTLRRQGGSGIGPGSFAALATLSRHGPLRLGDLAAREGVAPPTLTRMITGLEESGYVRREPDAHDRRAVRVMTTEEGDRLVRGVGSSQVAALRARLARGGDEEVEALVRALPLLEALSDGVD